MFRPLLIAALLLVQVLTAAAQTAAPDYAIRNIRGRISEDGAQAVVEFEVQNLGGAASERATASLKVIRTGEEIATGVVPPLASGGLFTVRLAFDTALFAPGSVESLRAAVGVDEVEPTGAQTLLNNYAQISLTFPERPEATPEPAPAAPEPADDPVNRLLAPLGIQVDWSDPVQLAIVAALALVALILLLILWVILRLLFGRPPSFGNWSPPYATAFPHDPNSVPGRRQQWQQHAQNNLLPPPTAEGAAYARKLLLGPDGRPLSGWQVMAIRICQYDMYGRLSRSQALAPRRLVRRLNGALRRAGALDDELLLRRLRPVGRGLAARLRRRVTERTAMLPVALDVRLRGKHGDVHILFELYQCRYGEWQRLDQWEPEMLVGGRWIEESYTFTAYGQRPGESTAAFYQRLGDDLTLALASMVSQPATTDTSPHAPTA